MYQNSNYNNGYSTRTPLMPTAPPAQVPMGLKGRPVSSLEEVRAAQIDFDGSIFIFPDMANKKIYTKQIDLNGNVKLEEYDWVPIEKSAAVGDFVTKQEFEETMAKVKEAISQAAQPQPQSKEGFNF